MIKRSKKNGDWCILRTSPARTLLLARALHDAGFEVWTPSQTLVRRRPRSQKTFERDVPIAPTFVFARARHAPELVYLMSLPISDLPPFSLFRHAGRVPLVDDQDIAGFRQEHEAARLQKLKTEKKKFGVGQRVRVAEGVAMGMTGIVEQPKGKDTLVNFGGGWAVKVSSWLLNLEPIEQTSIHSDALPRAA